MKKQETRTITVEKLEKMQEIIHEILTILRDGKHER